MVVERPSQSHNFNSTENMYNGIALKLVFTSTIHSIRLTLKKCVKKIPRKLLRASFHFVLVSYFVTLSKNVKSILDATQKKKSTGFNAL